MPAVVALLYIALALWVGWRGKDRVFGFVGFFILSLFLTPIITSFLLLISAPREIAD